MNTNNNDNYNVNHKDNDNVNDKDNDNVNDKDNENHLFNIIIQRQLKMYKDRITI